MIIDEKSKPKIKEVKVVMDEQIKLNFVSIIKQLRYNIAEVPFHIFMQTEGEK
jgi:hypothetical protein